MRKYVFFTLFLSVLFGTVAFSQSIWGGYVSAGMGVEFTENFGNMYLSSGFSVNKAAISLNQGIGLNIDCSVSQLTLFLRGGVSASILFASSTDANAVLLSGDSRIGARLHDFGVFVGVTKIFVFFNDTSNHIPSNGKLSPEFGVGYVW